MQKSLRQWRRLFCMLWIYAVRGLFLGSAFPELEAVWIYTSAGDEQVLLLTREALQALSH